MDAFEQEKRLWLFKRISLVSLIIGICISYLSNNRLPWIFLIYLLFFINMVCLADSIYSKNKERIVFESIMQGFMILIIYKLLEYQII